MIPERPNFAWTLTILLGFAFLLRLGYVLAQAGIDPMFAYPVADGAYYLDWARSLVTGTDGYTDGAFYRAPLYAYALAGFLRIFGEDFGLLYYSQHLLIVGTGALLALIGRRLVGQNAGLAACALFLLYHPSVFFASRPCSEPLSLVLMALSLYLAAEAPRWAPGGAGLCSGLAALARPGNLLLAPLWALDELRRRRWERAALLMAGLVLVLVPSTVRNYRASGHFVPVSSNAGLTLYHGNGPGADGGMILPMGFSGEIAAQRLEATRLASLHAGRPLDAVEADRSWGRRAREQRREDPLGTGALGLWRLALVASNRELPLGDGGPSLDTNPLRWAAPVPFALLLGLAAAGVALCGWRGSGGWLVWSTALACLAVPLIFYVGSRYRLPLSTVLCVPAGAGLVSLFVGSSSTGLRRRGVGWVILVAGVLISFFVPSEEMFAKREAVGLVQRAWAWGQVGDPAAAEADLRRALETDGDSVPALFNLARLFERTGRVGEAETTYRRALEVFPGSADAAGNLGRLLHRSGRADQAVPILRRALEYSPVHRVCWTNLVVALTLLGDPQAAWGAAEQALERGVELDPGLLGGIRQLREEREEKEKR